MAAVSGMMVAGAVASGASSAIASRNQRKAQDKQTKTQTNENALTRQHEKEMQEREIKRYKDAASSWQKYDFGAKPLIERATAPVVVAPNVPGGM